MNKPNFIRKRITIEVEKDLHVRVKTKASEMGKTIKKIVTDYLEKWTRK